MTSHSETWISPTCPCKDCDHRSMTCHCNCVQYKQWKAYKDRINARKQSENLSRADRKHIAFWQKKNKQDSMNKR